MCQHYIAENPLEQEDVCGLTASGLNKLLLSWIPIRLWLFSYWDRLETGGGQMVTFVPRAMSVSPMERIPRISKKQSFTRMTPIATIAFASFYPTVNIKSLVTPRRHSHFLLTMKCHQTNSRSRGCESLKRCGTPGGESSDERGWWSRPKVVGSDVTY